MFIAFARDSTFDLLMEYNRTFKDSQISGHYIIPSLPEEEFCRLIREAIDSGVPVPKEKVCMPPLPEGYVL